MTTANSKFTLQLINSKGAIEQTVQIDPLARAGQKAAPLKGEPGIRFNLFDTDTHVGPQKFVARRVGYDLQVFLHATDTQMAAQDQPDVVITDYYGTCAASELSVDELVGTDSCNFYSGQEGSNFKYMPEEGGRVKAMGWLNPGESSVYVVSAIAGVAPAGVVGLWGWGLLAGLGVGVAALAASGGDDKSAPLAVAKDVTVVDDVGEITGPIVAGSVTDDAMPTWNGAAGSTTPGSTVTVYDGSKNIGSTVSRDDGSWSFTPTVPLADGKHSLAVGVTDQDGAASPLTPALEFTVDTTPPARPESLGTIYDDVGPVTGPVAPGGTTDDTKPAVILAVAPTDGDKPVLIVDGAVVPSTYDPGTQTLTPTTPLTDGDHTIGYQVVDPAGNHSPTSPTVTITVDAGIQANIGFITEDTGPSSTDFITSDPTLVIGGTTISAPAGAKVEVSIDSGSGYVVIGSVPVATDGQWSLDHTDTPLTDGNYTVRTQVVDPSGVAVGAAVTSPLVIDTTDTNEGPKGPDNPDSNVTSTLGSITEDTGPSSSDFITSDTTLIVRGTSGNTGAGYHVQVLLDKGDGQGFQGVGYTTTEADGSWAFDYQGTPLADGTYQLRSQITDQAGVAVPNSINSHELVIDTTDANDGPKGPTNPDSNVTSTLGSVTEDTGPSSTDFITSDTTLIVHGTSANTGAGYNVQVLLDKGDGQGFQGVGYTTTRADGSWDFDYQGTPLADGTYQLRSQITDQAGVPVANSLNTHELVIDTTDANDGPKGPTNPDSNVTSTLGSVTEDTGPSSTDFITSDTTLIVHGTSANTGAGYNVQVLLDKGDGQGFQGVGYTTTRADGSWDFDYQGTPLADGTYQLRSQITDQAGVPVANSLNTHELVIDTTDANDGPKGPTNPDSNVTSTLGSITDDTGPSSTDFVTSDPTLVIHGTSANTGAGYNVAVLLDKNDGTGFGVIGYTTTAADGSWAFDYQGTPLADGTYQLRSQITDQAGVPVANSLNTHELVIDTSGTNTGPTGPTNPDPATFATITAISDDTGASATDFVTTDPTLIFHGTISVPQAGYYVKLELQSGSDVVDLGYATTTAGGLWEIDHRSTTLAPGSYTLRAVVTDLAGNPTADGAVASQLVRIENNVVLAPTDLDLPAVDDSGLSSTDNITNMPLVSVTGKGLAGATVTLFDEADPTQPLGTALVDDSGNFTIPDVVLAEGTHNLLATQADVAGTPSTQPSLPLTVTIDRSMPLAPTIDLGGYVSIWKSVGSDDGNYGIVGRRFDNVNGPIGSEFIINPVPSDVDGHAITALSNGGFVVSWTNDDAGDPNIHSRLYSPAGVPVGDEFTVNTLTAGDQGESSVHPLPGGGFMVSWTAFDLTDGLSSAVYARMYNAAGTPLAPEFRVTPTQPAAGHSDVGVFADGSFIVTWDSTEPNGDQRGVFAQRYSPEGAAVGSAIHVNTTTFSQQSDAVVQPLDDGGFVVTWQSNTDPNTNRFDVFLQRYDSNGAAVGSETRVNSSIAGANIFPDITLLDDGSYVVVWTGPDSNLTGVWAKHYSSTGVVLASDFQVNTYTNNYQSHPTVQALADGGFIVQWDSQNQVSAGAALDIYAQRYDASATRVGTEYLVNTTTGGSQEAPVLTSLDTELADHALSATEAADGTYVRVNVTSKGVSAGDTVVVDWGTQHVERTLTADEITSGYALVEVSRDLLVAAGAGNIAVTTHLTDKAGNVGADSATEIIQASAPAAASSLRVASSDVGALDAPADGANGPSTVAGTEVAATAKVPDSSSSADSAAHEVAGTVADGSHGVDGGSLVLTASDVAALNDHSAAGTATTIGDAKVESIVLSGANIVFDLGALQHSAAFKALDKIDLTGSGNNQLKLALTDVLDVSASGHFNASTGWAVPGATPESHQLVVDGNSGDSILLNGGWSAGAQVTHDLHTYQIYNAGTGNSLAQLLIDVDVQRTIV